MKEFKDLGLSKPLLDLLEKANMREPSEIQEKAIPPVLSGRDVIGKSATGSGKTLVFLAGLLENLQSGKGIQGLVLTPTRELAEQIGKVIRSYSSYKRINVSTVYGGVSIIPQIKSLRDSEIVVGTPGRILDHLERGTIDLSKIKILVLDEADRMLDMGFINDVENIIKNCPKKRQTLLFSATIPHQVQDITKKYMNNPEIVTADVYVDPTKLKQIYYDVQKTMKFSLLVYLIKNESPGLVMVFCNTRMNTDFVANNLKNLGVEAIAIHGGLTQDKRKKIMERFHSKRVYVLVCTDIAARGLDIKGVSHIYNYDIPKTSEDYIHRIGRTARAGKEGIAINVLSERDYENFSNVLRNESIHVEKKELPEKIEIVRFIVKKPFEGVKNKWDSRNWKERKERREGKIRNEDSGKRPRRHSGGRNNFGSKGRSFGGGRRNTRPQGRSHDKSNSRGRSFGNRWSKKRY